MKAGAWRSMFWFKSELVCSCWGRSGSSDYIGCGMYSWFDLMLAARSWSKVLWLNRSLLIVSSWIILCWSLSVNLVVLATFFWTFGTSIKVSVGSAKLSSFWSSLYFLGSCSWRTYELFAFSFLFISSVSFCF